VKFAPLIGDVMVEPAWRPPEGVSETPLVDNLTALHASYDAHPKFKVYPIAVRCLF
jgi:hypothetical protein